MGIPMMNALVAMAVSEHNRENGIAAQGFFHVVCGCPQPKDLRKIATGPS